MKTIKENELFQNLSDFLKVKGIELKDGVYVERMRRACSLLAEAINATQRTARKAKDEVEKKLDHLRQCIHEATASTPPPAAEPKAQPAAASNAEPTACPKPRKAASRRKRPTASAKRQRQ